MPKLTPKLAVFLAAAAVGLIGACDRDRGKDDADKAGSEVIEGVSSLPLPPRGSNPDGTLFEKLGSAVTGVDFTIPIDLKHPLKRLYHPGAACGGIGIGDLDGDDRPDIFFAGGPVGNRLYRQVDDFKFVDITAAAGIDVAGPWGSGVSLADVDNDGDLDIYVCNYDAPNLLYLNESGGEDLRFVEAAEQFGLDLVDASQTAAFADYDRDGDLDVLVLTNRYIREGGLPEKQPIEGDGKNILLLPGYEKYYRLDWVSETRFQIGQVGRADRLLRNDGERFVEVSSAAGIIEPGEGLSVTWWDYDRDGWPDIYVGNDFQDPDHLYKNNRDGTFTDVLDAMVPHTSWYSMGADMADLNNDGLVDFMTADMSATSHFMQKTTMGAMSKFRDFLENARPRQYMRNALYLNSGAGRFMEAAYLTGMADTDWTWSVKLADFDNDGWVDAYFTNGMSRSFNDSDRSVTVGDRIGKTEWDLYEDAPPRREQNLAFRNRGGLEFENASSAWGLDQVGMSLASAYADLDRDGDLDLVTANLDEEVSIYRNRAAAGHRLLVRLVGTKSNRRGLGARLEIESPGGEKLVRVANPMTGFKSTNDGLVHFGLGAQQTVGRLTVSWPSGIVQTLENLAADRLYTIREPDSQPVVPAGSRPEPARMFERFDGLSAALHQESPFDDFRLQPLLPNKLSQLGLGMAWGDADGDGDDDLYLCGAAGTRGQLLIRIWPGKFEPSGSWNFDIADDCEEMGAIFFDADSDGDDDLYVVSGGVEHPAGSDAYRDRLYLNDGKGYFSDTPGALPGSRDSGGVLAAADVDRDGDLDLFVGGRVIPAAYPVAPQSRLLLNRSEAGGVVRFEDVTDVMAPGLRKAGLVTGALWSDADGDGVLDLLVTREWGTVMLFRNDLDANRLEAREIASGSGWWNGIAGRDLDNDGDIDYVVTNFGLNTKYHASADKPALLYYGDFEASGRKRLVEAEFEHGVLFPIRGKSCSTEAMPALAGKFQTYRDFAKASLADIYSEDSLGDSLRLAAGNLRSGILINDGSGKFNFAALPHIAQIAPAFGVVLSDFDADGHCDIVLAQNFFTPQLETGRMDGGLGLLLFGEGGAKFRPVWPDRSGIVIAGDGKSLTTADLDGDAWPDFVVGINDGAAVAMLNRKSASRKSLRVRLAGKNGNADAIGAKVTLSLASGAEQSAEVYAGSGYLSQSIPDLFFGLGDEGGDGARISVRWPDGESTEFAEVPASGGVVVIRR